METSRSKAKPKAKSAVKPKRSASTAKAGQGRTKAAKNSPGENDIRAKAQELYFDRISRGENGTPEDDWLRAEQILRG
jgi:hypothetical protein